MRAGLSRAGTGPEAEIAAAMVFLLGSQRLDAEGGGAVGGAVGVGAALAGRLTGLDGPLAIVVSGGNADPAAILAPGRRPRGG